MPENTDSRGGVVNCPALLLSESLRAQLKVYGLSLAPGTTVCGEVAFESPVSVFSGSHVAFSSLGAYSYVSFGSKLVHASVGRYTSIAHQVEVGLSQHDIRAVSTSAALINAGWAVADTRQTQVYVPYQNQALTNKRGLWQGEFYMPWDWEKIQARKANVKVIRSKKSSGRRSVWFNPFGD